MTYSLIKTEAMLAPICNVAMALRCAEGPAARSCLDTMLLQKPGRLGATGGKFQPQIKKQDGTDH